MANPYSRGMQMVRLAAEKSSKRKPLKSSVNVPRKKIKSTPKHVHEEFVAPTYSPVHPLYTNTEEYVDEDLELNDSVGVGEPTARDLLNKCSDILNSFPEVSSCHGEKPACGNPTDYPENGEIFLRFRHTANHSDRSYLVTFRQIS